MKHVLIGKRHVSNDYGRADGLDIVDSYLPLLGCSTLCNVIKLGKENHHLSALIRSLVNYTFQSAEYWNSLSYLDRNQLTTAYITYRRSMIDDKQPSSWLECLTAAVSDKALIDNFNNVVS